MTDAINELGRPELTARPTKEDRQQERGAAWCGVLRRWACADDAPDYPNQAAVLAALERARLGAGQPPPDNRRSAQGEVEHLEWMVVADMAEHWIAEYNCARPERQIRMWQAFQQLTSWDYWGGIEHRGSRRYATLNCFHPSEALRKRRRRERRRRRKPQGV